MDTIPAPMAAGFVTAGLEQQDGISGFGTLLRLARLNRLCRVDFKAAFGLGMTRDDDPSWVLATSEIRMGALALATGRALKDLPDWRIEPWLPFAADRLWEVVPWTLRACPVCLRLCYHSMLFQMPWIARCPWHGAALTNACRKCGRHLLLSFHQRGAFMRCTCGVDQVSELATLKRADMHCASERSAFLTAYRRWSAATKRELSLVIPQTTEERGPEVLASLVRPPATLARWAGAFGHPSCHVEQIRAGAPTPLVQLNEEELVRCARSLWPAYQRMTALPQTELAPMRRITVSVAAAVPAAELTAEEQRILHRSDPPMASTRSSRTELLYLPLRNFPPLYLDTQVLQRAALGVVVDTVGNLLPSQDIDARYRGNDRVLGATIRSLLRRCYVDGLIHLLGRHAPGIYAHPRIRSAPRVPWVLIDRDGLRIRAVRIAWAQRRSWEVD